jgi:hypothetical protein
VVRRGRRREAEGERLFVLNLEHVERALLRLNVAIIMLILTKCACWVVEKSSIMAVELY